MQVEGTTESKAQFLHDAVFSNREATASYKPDNRFVRVDDGCEGLLNFYAETLFLKIFRSDAFVGSIDFSLWLSCNGKVVVSSFDLAYDKFFTELGRVLDSKGIPVVLKINQYVPSSFDEQIIDCCPYCGKERDKCVCGYCGGKQ